MGSRARRFARDTNHDGVGVTILDNAALDVIYARLVAISGTAAPASRGETAIDRIYAKLVEISGTAAPTTAGLTVADRIYRKLTEISGTAASTSGNELDLIYRKLAEIYAASPTPYGETALDRVFGTIDGPSLVAHASIGGSDGGTTASINTSGATLLVAILANGNSTTIGSSGVVSDSKSNTWTARNLAASGTAAYLRIFDCVAPTVGTGHTFTFTLVGGYPFLAVAAFKGRTGTFSKQGTSNDTNKTSLATGSITPDHRNALIVTGISCVNADSAPTCTIASVTDASAIAATVNYAGGMAFYAQQAAAAVNPTWSWATGNDCAAAIAVYGV